VNVRAFPAFSGTTTPGPSLVKRSSKLADGSAPLLGAALATLGVTAMIRTAAAANSDQAKPLRATLPRIGILLPAHAAAGCEPPTCVSLSRSAGAPDRSRPRLGACKKFRPRFAMVRDQASVSSSARRIAAGSRRDPARKFGVIAQPG
jgi:hypothetical protein